MSCYSISLALTPLGTICYTCSCLVTNSISLALTPLVCHSCFALTAWVIPQASSSGCWSRVLCRRPQSSLPGCHLTGSTFVHYLQSCIASRQWWTQLYHNQYNDWDHFPSTEELFCHKTPVILSLLNHSALGTPAFVQTKGIPF